MYHTAMFEWEEINTKSTRFDGNDGDGKYNGETLEKSNNKISCSGDNQNTTTTTAPPCIYDHSAVIATDANGQHPRMILFGGDINSSVYGELYVLDLETMKWDKPTTKGDKPTSRRGHSATMIDVDTMLVFGGTRHSSPSSEVFTMNTETYTWTKHHCRSVEGKNPAGRLLHTETFVPTKQAIYFHGGWNPDAGGRLSDTWQLKLPSLTWKKLKPKSLPPGRYRHSAVLHNESIYIFGGWIDTGRSNDIWQLDLNRENWKKMKIRGISPEIRTGQDMVFISPTDVFMFGGYNEKRNNDSWIFNIDSLKWKQVHVKGTRVEGRFGHTLCYVDGKIILFGGKGDNAVYMLRVGEPSSFTQDVCKLLESSKRGDSLVL